jgi:hypothetical protein
VMRRIALPGSVTDHSDPTGLGRCGRSFLVESGFFRPTLTTFLGRDLMNQMMQGAIGVIGFDNMFGCIGRSNINVEEVGPVMINRRQDCSWPA